MSNRMVIAVLESYRHERGAERIDVLDSKMTDIEKQRTLAYYGGQIDLLNELIDYFKKQPV